MMLLVVCIFQKLHHLHLTYHMLTYYLYHHHHQHHHHHQVSWVYCQSKYHIICFFCLMHIYIYDIILDIVLSSVQKCSHKIWCICAHMMCCNCDMYFVNISATSSSVATISAIDVSPASSSSSSSSSLPGNLSLLLQHT